MEISEESAIPAPSSESHEEKMEAESSTGNVNGEQQEHEVDASPEEHEEANPEEHEANPEEQEEHDTLKNQSVVLVENSLIIGRAECYGRMNQGPSEAVVVAIKPAFLKGKENSLELSKIRVQDWHGVTKTIAEAKSVAACDFAKASCSLEGSPRLEEKS